MADLCVCGHEEREHVMGRLVCLDCRELPCPGYRRSPLSAFRGPAVRMTRAEAHDALKLLGFGEYGCRHAYDHRPDLAGRDYVRQARWAIAEEPRVGMVYGYRGQRVRVERVTPGRNGRVYLRNLNINYPYSVPAHFWGELVSGVIRLTAP